MKIIHTADIHLDTCYNQDGFPAHFGNRRRQSLRDVFCGIVRHAAEWSADALLIAGDLFDIDYVSRDTVAFLRAQFELLRPIPVVIAPGNHDPVLPASPYLTEQWPENVIIFTKPQWETRTLCEGRLTVHGFGFDGYEPSQNPWGSLSFDPDGAVHIAIGHGSERSHQPPDAKTYCPFDAAAVAVPGLAYLALGHFHAPVEVRADGGHCPIHYSGAPAGHDFSETGPRHFLEVGIDAGQVDVRRVRSSREVFAVHTLDAGRFQSAQDLIDVLRSLSRASDLPQIARIKLIGTCPVPLSVELPAVHDAVAHDYEFIEFIDQTAAREDYAELARLQTTLGIFVRRISEEIGDADEARQAVLNRAREVGIAAYRNQKLPIRGADAELAP